MTQWSNFIESLIQLLAVAGAIILFGIAAKCFYEKDAAPAASAMAFAFLFLVFASVSKFKHFKGLGFEAETWDQKQVEAAVLIDRLKSLTDAVTMPIANLAAKMGYKEGSLSNPQLIELYNKLKSNLAAAEVSTDRQTELLQPVLDRISANYDIAVYLTAYLSARSHEKELLNKIEFAPEVEKSSLQIKLSELRGLQTVLIHEPLNMQTATGRAFISQKVKDIEVLREDAILTKALAEIDEDVAYLKANSTLRRNIDFSYLYDLMSKRD